MKAYLVLVTWEDGLEQLLFPRPGRTPIAETLEQGEADFATAHRHLKEFRQDTGFAEKVKLALVEFERGATMMESEG